MTSPALQHLCDATFVIAVLASSVQCVHGDDGSLSEEGLLAIIIVAIVLAIAALVSIVVICICKRKSRTKRQKYEVVSMRPTGKGRKPKHKASWEIPWTNVLLSNEVIGEGYFGDIHKSKIKDGLKRTTVAVAYLEGDASMTTRDAFHTELDLMKKIGRHRNIISIVGFSHSKNSLYVAFDFATNGDLRSFLRRHRLPSESTNISSLSPSRLLRFSVDVAKGMDYLSSIDIVHKTLCARSVMICNGMVAKVSGIGLSKQKPAKTSKRHGRHISFRWSAIESWSQKVFTQKSDVWSFGILLWEIITLGGTPYHAVSDSSLLQQRLADGHRLDKPSNCTDEMYNIMLFCWQDSPDDRPTFSDLLLDLSRIAEAKDISSQIFVTFKQTSGFIHAIVDPEHEDVYASE